MDFRTVLDPRRVEDLSADGPTAVFVVGFPCNDKAPPSNAHGRGKHLVKARERVDLEFVANLHPCAVKHLRINTPTGAILTVTCPCNDKTTTRKAGHRGHQAAL
eukprot:3805297-Rhodomonas_salina.1